MSETTPARAGYWHSCPVCRLPGAKPDCKHERTHKGSGSIFRFCEDCGAIRTEPR